MALEGYRTGKFPEGSVLVFDLLSTAETADGPMVETERRIIDVMVRGTEFESTGGWGFEEFLNYDTEKGLPLVVPMMENSLIV